MATITRPASSTRSRPAGYPAGGLRFDLLFCAVSAYLMFGAYLDGWAHNNLSADLETFFTPWHAVLYSGVALVGLVLAIVHVRNMNRGYPWGRTVPRGYHLSLIGVGIFGLSGGADALWHTFLGIEFGFDAAVSPPHLVGALAFVLTVSGPLRSVWARRTLHTRWEYLPAVLSLGLTLSGITVITQILNPITRPIPAAEFFTADPVLENAVQAWAFGGFLLQTLILVGLILLAVKRWGRDFPFGAFTLVLTLNGALLCFQTAEWRFLPAVIVTGLAADALRFRLDLAGIGLRIYATALPVILYSGYFLTLLLTDTIWWRVHSVTGAIALAGAVGCGVSLLIQPPTTPDAAADD